MYEILLATHNSHKIREIRKIFQHLPIQFLSLADFKNPPHVIEDGKTFKKNALKKAVQIAQWSRKISLADDSGIEVDALHGAPGIYSARFAGEKATDEENNIKLLEQLKNTPFEKRTARYQCVMAIATPDSFIQTTQGTCEGYIVLQPDGKEGFGYDPLFYYPPFQKTFGNTPPDQKNQVSHRFHALQKLEPILEKIINNKI